MRNRIVHNTKNRCMHAKKCNICRYFRQTFTNSETNYMTKLYFSLQIVYKARRNKSYNLQYKLLIVKRFSETNNVQIKRLRNIKLLKHSQVTVSFQTSLKLDMWSIINRFKPNNRKLAYKSLRRWKPFP